MEVVAIGMFLARDYLTYYNALEPSFYKFYGFDGFDFEATLGKNFRNLLIRKGSINITL
jgi:hypothetical protein